MFKTTPHELTLAVFFLVLLQQLKCFTMLLTQGSRYLPDRIDILPIVRKCVWFLADQNMLFIYRARLNFKHRSFSIPALYLIILYKTPRKNTTRIRLTVIEEFS